MTITDLEIEKARKQIAGALTAFNYNLSKKDALFPRDNINVSPEQILLEACVDKELLEFKYAGWRCYVAHDADRILNMAGYLKREKLTVEFSGNVDGLAYLIANEGVRKK